MARGLHKTDGTMQRSAGLEKIHRLEIANLSDSGRKRANNEDSTATDEQSGLVVVADGMGGYRSGEIASAIAVSVIVEDIRNEMSKHCGAESNGVTTTAAALIQNAVKNANATIFRTAQNDPKCCGMGTTVVCALFNGGRITIAHVGDSRVYRLRDQQFKQLTSDHSLVQELVDRGVYSPQQASVHTPRNLVTRALGIDLTVEIDVTEEDIRTDDIFLLCTDGLNDMVGDEDIQAIVENFRADLNGAAQRLINLANENGGKDNVSVVLAKVLGSPRPKRWRVPGLPKAFS